MQFENAFFRKELRASRRRQFAFWAVLSAQTVLLTLPLLLLVGRLGGPGEKAVVAMLLALCHAAACGAAGWVLGSRVFMEEHRQGTMEALYLVSLSPWRWFPQKLLFPLYGLAVIWAAAIPCYAAFGLRGYLLPRQVETGFLFAGCIGLVTLSAALMLPPEGLRSRVRERLAGTDVLPDLANLALPYWTGMVILRLGSDWVLFVGELRREPFRSMPFYAGTLDTAAGLAVLMTAVLAAALATGLATAAPSSPLARQVRTGVRAAAFAAAYYLFVGYAWTGMGPFYRILTLAGLPLVAGAFRFIAARNRKRARPEDPAAGREIAWFARWSDNPVLIRDLRVALRALGLRRRSLLIAAGLVAGCVLFGGVMPALFMRSVPPAQQVIEGIRITAIVLGTTLGFPFLLTFGNYAVAQWRAEQRMKTVPQLLGTPITAEEVVRGRWIGALVIGIPPAALCLALYFAGLLSLGGIEPAARSFPFVAWLGSLGLLLSAGLAGAVQGRFQLRDLASPSAIALYVLIAQAWGFFALVIKFPYAADAIAAVYPIGMAVVNGYLTTVLFRFSAFQLERLRRRDFEA